MADEISEPASQIRSTLKQDLYWAAIRPNGLKRGIESEYPEDCACGARSIDGCFCCHGPRTSAALATFFGLDSGCSDHADEAY